MRNINEDTITLAVLEAMADCQNECLRTVMFSLVQHLHAFTREVKLTEAEWFEGIKFLTAAGHITDDKRQEFILLSDVLGLLMLVADRLSGLATPSRWIPDCLSWRFRPPMPAAK